MSSDKEKNMLDELQDLLEQQITLVHQGNSTGGRFETLNGRVDSLVRKIAETKILEQEDMEDKRTKLRKSYDRLRLAITAQRDEIADKLGQVRKGRKTIETYLSNI
jgi:hypothetical protein